MKGIVAVGLVLLSGMASAQPRTASPRTTYLAARLGAVVPQHDDLDFYDSGLAFDLGLGFEISPNLAMEAAVGRYAMSGRFSYEDPFFGVVTVDGDQSVVPVTGTVKLGSSGGVRVYGLAGLGLLFVSESFDSSAPGYATTTESDDATAFGLHLGGGLGASLSPQISLGLEARYLIAEATLFGQDVGLNSVLIEGALAFRF